MRLGLKKDTVTYVSVKRRVMLLAVFAECAVLFVRSTLYVSEATVLPLTTSEQ